MTDESTGGSMFEATCTPGQRPYDLQTWAHPLTPVVLQPKNPAHTFGEESSGCGVWLRCNPPDNGEIHEKSMAPLGIRIWTPKLIVAVVPQTSPSMDPDLPSWYTVRIQTSSAEFWAFEVWISRLHDDDESGYPGPPVHHLVQDMKARGDLPWNTRVPDVQLPNPIPAPAREEPGSRPGARGAREPAIAPTG
jgi:hypothetical protein